MDKYNCHMFRQLKNLGKYVNSSTASEGLSLGLRSLNENWGRKGNK